MARTGLLRFAVPLALAVALAAVLAFRGGSDPSPGARSTGAAAAASGVAPAFDASFWKLWGDGRAELAGYDLTFTRYRESRKGVAVTIFVTETFSNSLRVKSDPGRHPRSDEVPVMKLNLVQDFPTGLYDYNLMTSTFVALSPANGRPAGSATKVSFSSQEWCGNLYGQLLFDSESARLTWHSYFDGEADQERKLAVPPEALAADAILLWARGFAAPVLSAGERREVPLAGSLRQSRMRHRPLEVVRAVMVRDASASSVTVPAGRFEVERRTVEIAGGPTWTIHVEKAEPHRIIQWETSDGEKASLLASERFAYWKMNGEGQEAALARLGLKPRAARTP